MTPFGVTHGDGVRADRRPHALILYHYFYPDDVVSARHFDDLAVGLVERGWRVTAAPCNRGCRDESRTYPPHNHWRGVEISRVWRPALKQGRSLGRVLNALWMLAAWSVMALKRARPDVVIVGTDPILSVLTAWVWGRSPSAVAHWCFDLYPEAAVADGLIAPRSPLLALLRPLVAGAYRRCRLLADLGPCMRRRLAAYRSPARAVTLTPWALAEPVAPAEPDPAARHELYGDAALGLLYSGSFGRAHSSAEFLDLARRLRGDGAVCFAARGNRIDEVRSAVTPDDANVRFAGFASEVDLERRLAAADVHLVSLRPEWTGLVVPSKFFGSLAVGRPVVFAGDPDSALGSWVRELSVGWVLTADSAPAVADELRRLARRPADLRTLQGHCHRIYRARFARERVVDSWDRELRRLVQARGGRP